MSMIRCSRCGAKLNKRDRFCRACGKEVSPIENNMFHGSLHESDRKEKSSGKKNGIFIIVFILIVVGILGGGENDSSKTHHDTPDIVLRNNIPALEIEKEEIVVNDENVLEVHVSEYDEDQFHDYVNQCTEKGYNLDKIYNQNISYRAYNDQGDLLVLSYKDHIMNVRLEMSVGYTYLNFEDYHLLYDLPIYNQCQGEVVSDTDNEMKVHVKNVSYDQYKDYVIECKKAGYSKDIKQGDTSYKASHKNKATLSLVYSKDRTMDIVVKRVMYDVQVELYYCNIVLFRKYDVEVFVDGNYKATLSDLQREGLEWKLSEGKHHIRFVSHDDANVVGNDTITISENTKFKYNINGWKNEIEYDRDDYLHVAYINKDLGKLKVDEVSKAYKNLGYENVELKPLGDLDYHNYNKHNGIVTLIEVGNSYNIYNNKDSLKKADRYFSYEPVKIHYHSAKELDMPGNSDSLKKLTRDEVVKYMKDLGFTHVKTQVYSGSYPRDVHHLDIQDISINGKNEFKQGHRFAFDSEIVITYYSIK